MPSHIRIFFWLSVAVVAIWVTRAALFWIPAAPYLSGLGKDYVRIAVEGTIFGTIPLCVATFATAWMVTYRHSNRARWMFVGLFLLREIIRLANAKVDDFMGADEYVRLVLIKPHQLVVTLPLLAASVLVFTGNARDWFKLPARRSDNAART